MKKIVAPLVLLLIAFACVCVLFLQPLRLIRDDSTRITLHPGKNVPLYAVMDMAGGYRCYVNEDEYFWLSSDECTQEFGDSLSVHFSLNEPATLYRVAP